VQGSSVIISGPGGPPVASVTPQTSELVGDFFAYAFVLLLHSDFTVHVIIIIKAIYHCIFLFFPLFANY
jgi:hypothetical protein